ncbi:MAG: MauE/DoxX family redox-associated membrane protein [Desulfovibrionaceae bacterium]
MFKAVVFSWPPYLAARLLLAGVLVFAAVPKLLEPRLFAEVIQAYGLLPDALLLPTAIGLPLAELVLAVFLLLDRPWAVGGTALLLAGFMLVLGWGIWLGLDVDCGCFGPEDPKGQAFHGLREAMLRDVGLLFCCGYLKLYRMARYQRGAEETLLAARTT